MKSVVENENYFLKNGDGLESDLQMELSMSTCLPEVPQIINCYLHEGTYNV